MKLSLVREGKVKEGKVGQSKRGQSWGKLGKVMMLVRVGKVKRGESNTLGKVFMSFNGQSCAK